MREFLKRLRNLLQPMVERGGLADEVERAMYASGVVSEVLSYEPNELMNEATDVFAGDEIIPLLLQLMRIYKREGNSRGFVYVTYRLARIYQKSRPVETAGI